MFDYRNSIRNMIYISLIGCNYVDYLQVRKQTNVDWTHKDV